MPIEIKCGQCGFANPLGRMHCVKCGAEIRPSEDRVVRRGESGGAARFVFRLVRIAVFLALLAAVVLMLRPVAPGGQDGGPQDAIRARQKLGLLKGAVLDGYANSQRLSEAEINGYLADLLEKTSSGSASSLKLRKVNFALNDPTVALVLVSDLGPATLTYEITGELTRGADRKCGFAVQTVRLGHLPMPGGLGDWLSARAFVVFSRLREERTLLDQMAAVSVGQGEITLTSPDRRG